ncbi:MAG TPA: hypothetical protein PLM75_09005 [bacterium]|nr:hypothetical protein [bacterium]
MVKKKAMSSEKASFVKKQGHRDAIEFAEILGIGKEYRSEPQAKKDVIDNEGHAYSVKSGEKKWQIFLYSKTRFQKDFTFKGMNGLSEILLECIEAFPENRTEYLQDKKKYKEKLKEPMQKLCAKLKNKELLAAFIHKSIFNSGEVNFLVIKNDNKFNVFYNEDVVNILKSNFEVENSKAKTQNQMDNQKVLFKINNKTCGEIEMRNDSDIHYREIKFWLSKKLTFELLISKIENIKILKNQKLIFYGQETIKKLKYIN